MAYNTKLPNFLDAPKMSPYAAHGWDLYAGEAGDQIAGRSSANIGDEHRIATRKEGGEDLFLAKFREMGIVLPNIDNISLPKGIVIKLAADKHLIRRYPDQAVIVCFGCTRLTPTCDIEADHFQPKSNIIHRQVKYWKQLKDGYFLLDQCSNPLFFRMFDFNYDGLRYTKLFQAAYVHSEDNFWPLCKSCNGLSKKCNLDPITFLKKHTWYGKDFVKKLPPIDFSGILVRAGNRKRPLVQLVIDWLAKEANYAMEKRLLYEEYYFNARIIHHEDISTEKYRQLEHRYLDVIRQFDPKANPIDQKARQEAKDIVYTLYHRVYSHLYIKMTKEGG